MKELNNCKVILWLKSSQYIAIKHLSLEDDRAMSAYLRRIVDEHLDQVSARMAASDTPDLGHERD